MAVRTATNTDLQRLRSDGQFSRLYLGVPSSPTVCAGTVSAAPASNDGVTSVAWTVTSGSAAAVERDMTCLVGTAVGKSDVGAVRVRKAPTADTLYIGETSEIAWAEGMHLTVLREFALWARHLVVPSEVPADMRMDGDVAYTDQHAAREPLILMGGPRVLWLEEGTASTQYAATADPFDSSVASWAWACPGAASITGGTTASPTLTFSSAGTYWVSAMVTLANGKSWKAWRLVLVYDDAHPPVTEFVLNSCYGQGGSGGWDFDVTLYGEASLLEIPPTSPVVLFARDWWESGTVESHQAAKSGAEAPVVAFGWAGDETLEPDRLGGDVMVKVKGPAWWLKQIPAMLFGIEDTDYADNGGGAPSNWAEMEDLNPDKALWALLHERCTLTRVCDLELPGFTEGLAQASARGRTLWSQAQYLAVELAMGRILCDRHGTCWIERDPRFMLAAERASLPTVMTVTTEDASELYMQKRGIPDVGYAEVSGVYFAGGESAPIGARSPGTVPRHHGSDEVNLSNLALPYLQSEVSERAGWAAGSGAGEFNYIGVTMAQNNRLLDIAPAAYVLVTVAAEDSPRQQQVTQHKTFVDGMGHLYGMNGLLDTRLDLTSEGKLLPAVKMEFPGEGAQPPTEPPEPPGPPEPPPNEPPEEPPEPEPGTGNALALAFHAIKSTANLSATGPTWTSEL